ncbi:MAG: outer membrane protein assembly factor BamA [Gammaproteobacteria bacterium]|jgi:outer membrane protein insertion porin family|nr:outer membrane protein assembly factor BamA [Gammaproteobacteria bacterium]
MHANRFARTCLFLFAVCFISASNAAEPFVVQDIRLEGLQRISAGTIFNYLPIKVGDRVDSKRTGEALRALYKTGFFRDVRIEREGDALVVSLHERPSIASIEFSGNKELSTEDLEASLAQEGFAQGRVFNRSTFDMVEQELRRTYFAVGKYGVKIESTITPLERNRVGVSFDISEGAVATIKQINIVGNTVYDDDDLVDLFTLETTGFWSWISSSDQYSKQKLSADLETLRSFYLDNGYINFNIDSTQVSITPDKKDVYITINITEGNQFTVDEIRMAGEILVPQEELFGLVAIAHGDIFSRQKITETSSNISDWLGNEGYAFANINSVPEIDEENKQVDLTFFLDPGKRVYVRRINFKGNTTTEDKVLRREMRQLEGGWISTGAIERSKERLERLGFFEGVNVETPAVPGTTDQVDVNFSVTEKSSGSLIIGAGFSQVAGLSINLGLTQENFFGTGNRVSATFNTSSINRTFAVGWMNPYITKDGVSLSVDVFSRKTNAGNANLADYDLEELGFRIGTGIPISEFNTLDLAITPKRTNFNPGTDPSDEVLAFEEETGGEYITYTLSAGWANDTRDSFLLPSKGSRTSFVTDVAVPGGDLSYYKLTFRYQQLIDLTRLFAIRFDTELGYGDGYGDTVGLPLTENYFAGGIRSVRAYEANTLGPRDSKGEPIGGDRKVTGTVELILPLPFIRDSKAFRITTFVDAGNVFGPGQDIEFEAFRASAGVSAIWLSPFGPLTISLGWPFNDQPGDDIQNFQFTLGTAF